MESLFMTSPVIPGFSNKGMMPDPVARVSFGVGDFCFHACKGDLARKLSASSPDEMEKLMDNPDKRRLICQTARYLQRESGFNVFRVSGFHSDGYELFVNAIKILPAYSKEARNLYDQLPDRARQEFDFYTRKGRKDAREYAVVVFENGFVFPLLRQTTWFGDKHQILDTSGKSLWNSKQPIPGTREQFILPLQQAWQAVLRKVCPRALATEPVSPRDFKALMRKSAKQAMNPAAPASVKFL